MWPVSDGFLLTLAEVSASLIGLFLVGVFFYVETGLRRSDRARALFEPYLRAPCCASTFKGWITCGAVRWAQHPPHRRAAVIQR
jgi:hypothetical protein